MFSKQEGFLPKATFYAGILLSLYFLWQMVVFLINFINLVTLLAATTTPVAPPAYLRAIVLVLFYAIMIFIGYLLWSLFPSIRLTEAGLEYKSLFVRRVAWEEMVDLLNATHPKGAKVLVFFRKPRHFWLTILDNAIRLYPNQTHGALTGVHEPVVVLSKGLQNRDQILRTIQARLDQMGRKRELSGDELLQQLEKK